MASKVCLFCRRRFAPYAPQESRQHVCRRWKCRYKLRLLLNRAWKRRGGEKWRQQANCVLRSWALAYPHYWRAYRKRHRRYAARDNRRRGRALKRQRWGCSAKDE